MDKMHDANIYKRGTWKDFTEMRTGFLSALTVLITAQSLQFYQLMNLQRELARNGTELSSQRT